jgi:hypothetical protein
MRAIAALVLTVLVLAAGAAHAGVPRYIQHHGRLLGPENEPVNGTVHLTLKLFEGESPPTLGTEEAVWSGDYTVTAANGIYSLVLGDGAEGRTVLPENAFPVSGTRYLEITVEGARLTPRLPVGSVPFAFTADSAATAVQAVNADKLDNLDSSAFAPASIETKVDAIDAATGAAGPIQTKLGAIQSSMASGGPVGTALADLAASLSAVESASGSTGPIQTALGSAASDLATLKGQTDGVESGIADVASAMGALDGKVATATALTALDGKVATATALTALDGKVATATALATLQGDVTTIKSDVATIKTAVLAQKHPNYSANCQNFAAKGWADEYECLHDGRWHLYFTMTGAGRTDQGGTATRQGLFDAAKAGADIKVRLGREWYALTVRSNDTPSDGFWCFITDVNPYNLSFYVRPTSITDVHVQTNVSETYYHDNWRSSDLGNRHYMPYGYSSRGAFSDLNQNGGVEFWARY